MTIHHEENKDQHERSPGSPEQSVLSYDLSPEQAAITLLTSPSFDRIRPALSALSQAEDYKAFTACVCTALTADDSYARIEAIRTAATINPSSESALWTLNALNPEHRIETNALQVLAEKFPEAAAPLARALSHSGLPQERLEALTAIQGTMPLFAREIALDLQNDASGAVSLLAKDVLASTDPTATSLHTTASLAPVIYNYQGALLKGNNGAQQKAIVALSQAEPHDAPLALGVLASAIKSSEGSNTRVALAAFGKLEEASYQSKDLTRILRGHHF